MRHPRIYINEPIEPGAALQIRGRPRHHLVNVLRTKAGDELFVFNGQSSQQALAKVVSVDRKSISIRVYRLTETATESPLEITLVQAISKNDKMDFSIQKSVELGVTQIQPVYTKKSIQPLANDRSLKRLAHWEQIIVSASEQSGRTRLPLLKPPLMLTDYFGQRDPTRTAYILEPNAEQPGFDHALSPAGIEIAIGPEGGFTNAEVDAAKQAGMTAVSMGPRILRSETATVTALTWLQISFGDFAPLTDD